MGRECTLRGGRGGDSVARAPEDDEERLRLTVDHVPVMGAERPVKKTRVIRDDRSVVGSELVLQPCGTLDVGEKQADGSAGQRFHARIVRHGRPRQPPAASWRNCVRSSRVSGRPARAASASRSSTLPQTAQS